MIIFYKRTLSQLLTVLKIPEFKHLENSGVIFQNLFYQTSFDLLTGHTCIFFFFTEFIKSNILISDSIFIKLQIPPILSLISNPRNNKKYLVHAWHCLCLLFKRKLYRFFLGNFLQNLFLINIKLFTSYLNNLLTNKSLVFNI